MSDENQSVSDATQPVSTPAENEEQNVSKKAFEEVSRDMHKYKREREELKAAANELRTQLKLQEEAKMHEQEQWKELYEKRELELEQERKRSQEQSSKFTNSVKRSSLKQELGGKIKEEYLAFANLEQISMTEDGLIDPESLRNVANEFRKQHGQLIPQSESSEITGHASTVNDITQTVDVSKLSPAELVKHYAKLKQSN